MVPRNISELRGIEYEMSPKLFRDWQARMGWTAAEAAKRLGKSPDTISAYRIKGVPGAQAVVVRLAMAALEHRLEVA